MHMPRKSLEVYEPKDAYHFHACRVRANDIGRQQQVAVSPTAETAEAAAREVRDVSSNVNLKILEALTAMQERMACLGYRSSREKRTSARKALKKLMSFSSHLKFFWIISHGDEFDSAY